MFSSIYAFFMGLFQALNILDKWFPKKTTEQKVEDGEKAVADEVQKMKDEGRP